MQALAGGKPAPLPRKLGEMAAEEMSNFCGECHRTWESVVGLRLFGEKNVRFQPYRLANSQCFLGRRQAHTLHGLPRSARGCGARRRQLRPGLFGVS